MEEKNNLSTTLDVAFNFFKFAKKMDKLNIGEKCYIEGVVDGIICSKNKDVESEEENEAT